MHIPARRVPPEIHRSADPALRCGSRCRLLLKCSAAPCLRELLRFCHSALHRSPPMPRREATDSSSCLQSSCRSCRPLPTRRSSRPEYKHLSHGNGQPGFQLQQFPAACRPRCRSAGMLPPPRADTESRHHDPVFPDAQVREKGALPMPVRLLCTVHPGWHRTSAIKVRARIRCTTSKFRPESSDLYNVRRSVQKAACFLFFHIPQLSCFSVFHTTPMSVSRSSPFMF